MEKRLCEAAIRGNIDWLAEIISEDELILDKVVVGSFSSWSPLHTSAAHGHTEFVKALLERNPKLAQVLDSADQTALHLASADGHVAVVSVLVKAAPEICLARDRHGRNPVHVAAMHGKEDVLENMARIRPHAARARLDQDQTILHLCVKHNQLGALKKLHEMIHDKEFMDAKDSEGNTILHLAVAGNQVEIIKYLIDKKEITVNATNASGLTAMDILHSAKIKKEDEPNVNKIEAYLQKAKAKRGKSLKQGKWVGENRDPLMVVASLIATIAFQAGVSPPGGVWQDSSEGHRAGEAVMAHHYPEFYPWFLRFSTVGFVASLSTILLLNSGLHMRRRAFMWMLMMLMWLAITSTATCYAVAIVWVTPKEDRKPTIIVAVLVFCSVMAILLIIHTARLMGIMIHEQLIIRKAMRQVEEEVNRSEWKLMRLVKNLFNRRSQSSIENQPSKNPNSATESQASV